MQDLYQPKVNRCVNVSLKKTWPNDLEFHPNVNIYVLYLLVWDVGQIYPNYVPLLMSVRTDVH